MSLQNKLYSRVFIWRYNIKYLIWNPVSQLLKAPYYAQFTNAISVPVYLSSSQEALKRGRSSKALLWTGCKNWMFFGVCSQQRVEYRSAALLGKTVWILKVLFCVSVPAAVSGHSERHQPESPVPSKRPSSRSETSENPLSSKRPRTAEKRSAAEQVGDPDNTHRCLQMFPKTTEAQLPASH